MVLCAGLFLIGLDVTVLNVALPLIQHELRPTPQGLLWIADAYTLALAGTVLAAGTWSDRHGRRRAFHLGLTLCGAASLSGALSSAPGQLITARLVMGLGAALLMPSTLSLITVVFPQERARRRAIAVWTLVAALGALAGPPVGGLLIEHFSWRAGFWINLPVVVIALAGSWRWLPEARRTRRGPACRAGLTAATAALLTLVWSIIEAPARGWSDPVVVGGFILAIALLAVAAWSQTRTTTPILPMSVLRDARFTASASALACMFFALFGSLLLLTLYLQTYLGYSPARTGLHLLPLAAALGTGAGLSLLLTPRLGDRFPVTTGMLLTAAGFGFLIHTGPGSGYAPVLGFQLVTGLGAGLAAAPATEAVIAAIPPGHAGTGAAVNDLVREVGGALGIAVLGTLLTSAPGHFLTGLHHAAWTAAATALTAAAIALRWLPSTPAGGGEDRDIVPRRPDQTAPRHSRTRT
ncbi:MFS transporter [Streptomyces xanthochromogenes]|uniref:MFS transporter n=1 Tax=Streptomyces xanthochromogenes TaxID=67384 RepID=UPI0038272425